MIVKLRTNDDDTIEVDSDDLKISGLIHEMLPSILEQDEEIPLFNVSGRAMHHVLEFTRHYRTEPMKTIEKPLRDDGLCVQSWYMDFIGRIIRKEEDWINVLHAATYLDIQPLEELLCAWIASTLQGKECDTLKSIFGFDYLR